MKSLRRSIISSSTLWVSYVLYGYFVLIRGVLLTGRWDYLIFGNEGKNFLLSIGYCIGFVIFTRNVYTKTLLPCFEMVVHKQVVDKITQINWVRPEKNGMFLPWTLMTYIHINNEKGVFMFPDSLPDDIDKHRVRILFLRHSKLILQVSAAKRFMPTAT